MSPRWAAATDDNQAAIVRALRSVGASVYVTSRLGGGFPDLAVGYRGRTELLEVKDGTKPPSRRALTPDEERFVRSWRGRPVVVVESIVEALRAIGVPPPREEEERT